MTLICTPAAPKRLNRLPRLRAQLIAQRNQPEGRHAVGQAGGLIAVAVAQHFRVRMMGHQQHAQPLARPGGELRLQGPPVRPVVGAGAVRWGRSISGAPSA